MGLQISGDKCEREYQSAYSTFNDVRDRFAQIAYSHDFRNHQRECPNDEIAPLWNHPDTHGTLDFNELERVVAEMAVHLEIIPRPSNPHSDWILTQLFSLYDLFREAWIERDILHFH